MLAKIHEQFNSKSKVKLLIVFFVFTLLIFIAASVLGEIVKPEINTLRPDFDIYFRGAIFLSVFLSVIIFLILIYERMVYKIGNKFVKVTKRSSGLAILMTLFVFLYSTYVFAYIIYKPSVDSGFATLLPVFALFHALWVVPAVELIGSLLLKDSTT